MKIQTSNKVKDYESVFSKEKEIKEASIKLNNGVEIFITEQQCGTALNQPHFTIATKDCTYDIDFDVFINKITK